MSLNNQLICLVVLFFSHVTSLQYLHRYCRTSFSVSKRMMIF